MSRFDNEQRAEQTRIGSESIGTNGPMTNGRPVAGLPLRLCCVKLAHPMPDETVVSALRQRIANLEMLDGLLTTVAGVLDIRQVFDRVSAIAQQVLPHDALSIAESIDEGRRVRVHA